MHEANSGRLQVPPGVLLLCFGQPRLSTAQLLNLTKRLQAAGAEGVRAAILTGSGSAFCLGGDLGNYPEQSPEQIHSFGRALIDFHLAITTSQVPVIAAVNGPALGGGLSLVEACDLAVAGRSARFGVPEIRSGLAPMISLVGVRLLGSRKHAMELALFGDELEAATALQRGIVNQVVEDSEVLPFALRWAEQLAQASPTAVALCKQAYADMDLGIYRRQLDAALNHLVRLLTSEDGREAYRAKAEGRSPTWSGAAENARDAASPN